MNTEISRYHRGLFRWHCRRFFDFQNAFSRVEHKYLRRCWNLAESYQEISEGGYRHFSYYTYSHRVKRETVNSSRIAYGSVSQPKRAFQAAEAVIAERGLTLPESLTENTLFYGLGWDFKEDQFKIYFRTLEWSRLHEDFLILTKGYDPREHRAEALLSITYIAGAPAEHKIYLYPLDHLLPKGVQGYARMITDTRGEVSQEDLDPKKAHEHHYNSKGRDIIEAYKEIGEPLDTVAYKSGEDFTLYFP